MVFDSQLMRMHKIFIRFFFAQQFICFPRSLLACKICTYIYKNICVCLCDRAWVHKLCSIYNFSYEQLRALSSLTGYLRQWKWEINAYIWTLCRHCKRLYTHTYDCLYTYCMHTYLCTCWKISLVGPFNCLASNGKNA